VATSRHTPTRAWLRWFGSGPHLAGAALALFVMAAALSGALETVLRLHFQTWWWVVVVAAYLAGWVLTGLVMWLGSAIGRRGRSLRAGFYPPVDAAAEAWLAREQSPVRRWRWVAVGLGCGVLGVVLFGFGLEKANAVAGVIGVMLTMLSFLTPALDARRRQ